MVTLVKGSGEYSWVREGAGRAAEAEEMPPSGGAENIGTLVFAPMGWRWKI